VTEHLTTEKARREEGMNQAIKEEGTGKNASGPGDRVCRDQRDMRNYRGRNAAKGDGGDE